MKSLIINADDFGLSRGVSEGISLALDRGMVSSTTIMACVEGALDDLQLWRSQVSETFGVHLQLNCGHPRAKIESIPSLVQGVKLPDEVPSPDFVNPEDVQREWTAQVKAVIDMGIRVTHADSHHGFHRHPRLFDSFTSVIRSFGLAARGGDHDFCTKLRRAGIKTTDLCDSRWSRGEISAQRFIRLVREDFTLLGEQGCVEIVTHPGLVDDQLRTLTSLSDQRAEELKVLSSPELRDLLAAEEIRLISFKDLPCDNT